jgi:hypothetical protein
MLGIDGSSANISSENSCQLARLIVKHDYIFINILDLFIRDIKRVKELIVCLNYIFQLVPMCIIKAI